MGKLIITPYSGGILSALYDGGRVRLLDWNAPGEKIRCGDVFRAKIVSISRNISAAFADLGDGRLADAGLAGAVLTDDADAFEKYYAYHNCGRPQDAGASLSFDAILGGDLRIAEWQCALIRGQIGLIPERLRECREESAVVAEKTAPVALVPGGVSSRRGTLVAGEKTGGLRYAPCFELMCDAPVWSSGFFLKCTGAAGVRRGSFPVSRYASENARLAYPAEKEKNDRV